MPAGSSLPSYLHKSWASSRQISAFNETYPSVYVCVCMWYNSFGAARVALVRGGGLCIQFVRRPLHTAMMTCSQLVWVLRPNKVSEWVCSLLSGKFNLTLCLCVCVYEQTKRRTHLSKHCIKAGTVLIIRTHTHARLTHAHTHIWRTSCADSRAESKGGQRTNTNKQIAQRNVTSFA